MNFRTQPLQTAIAGVFALALAGPVLAQNPCAAKSANPCAARSANPCAAQNPCAAGSKVDPKLVTRPKGTKLAKGNRAEMLKLGEALWNDTRLSSNKLSCNTCHTGNASFQNTFAKPYPHYVAMAKHQGGFKKINLDEMVQFCLVVPMKSKPLAWNSKELAALTMYTAQMQKSFKPSAAAKGNPCAAQNPCAAKNPCAATNPCAAKK